MIVRNGSVAKNILATFHNRDELAGATTSCVVSEFLQQIHQSGLPKPHVLFQQVENLLQLFIMKRVAQALHHVGGVSLHFFLTLLRKRRQ
jgi:hypothetical protein